MNFVVKNENPKLKTWPWKEAPTGVAVRVLEAQSNEYLHMGDIIVIFRPLCGPDRFIWNSNTAYNAMFKSGTLHQPAYPMTVQEIPDQENYFIGFSA